jgi:hypothetical protein
MKSLIVLLGCLLISTGVSARKPAVEDFMGVPPESEPLAPAGTEVLVNFADNLDTLKDAPRVVIRPAGAPAEASTGLSLSPWWALLAVFLMPLATWGLVMRRMPTSGALPDNVTALPARRKVSAAEENGSQDRKAS